MSLSCSLLLKFSPLKFLVKLIFFLLMRCYCKVFPKRLSINFIRIQTTFFKFSVEYCKTWAHKFYKCETCKQQIRILWTIYNWQDTKTLLLHYFFQWALEFDAIFTIVCVVVQQRFQITKINLQKFGPFSKETHQGPSQREEDKWLFQVFIDSDH